MPTVIPVKFKYAARDLWFDPAETGAQEADHVICSTERGLEIGLATSDAREVTPDELSGAIGHSQLKKVDRIATPADLAHAERLAEKGEEALPTFRRLVHESGLDMKPVGVEYLFGGEKVVCYFAAEERVDFRQLVRDLSHTLHERIDMRQIGVREEAAIMGGYGHCGQELCCRRFGLQFEPVSIRMAKEQDLPLNSNKISGACGRLMCCLRYEFEAYRDFKSRAPKRNAVIDTPLGKAKIVEYDTPKEQICLRVENGKQIRVPLAEMVASDAAKHKSEELGCPCRPDTVLRSTLDKLNSPDVQMALAELDRKMGVTPKEPTFDESDIFVETKARRSRGRSGGRQEAREESGQASSRRRRGRSPMGQGHVQKDSIQSGAGSGAGSVTRTRRHHRRGPGDDQQRSGQQADGAQVQSQQSQQGVAQEGDARSTTHRRRHHRSAAPGTPSQRQPQGQAQGQKTQEQSQGQAPARHMRHPGDHGGQRQRQGQGQTASQGGGTQAGDGSGEARQRRRRHRGGRGRGRASGGKTPGGEG